MKKEIYEQMKTIFDGGAKEITVILSDGEKMNLRLFMATSGTLAYFKKGGTRHGFSVWNLDVTEIVSSKKEKAVKTCRENYFDNLKKFKRAFSKMVHPNLWENLQKGYADFDVDEFEKFATSYLDGDLCQACFEFRQRKNIKGDSADIMNENHYKTTTVDSNKPEKYKYNNGQYAAYKANITRHLAQKENFHYNWRSQYDVTVSGKMCEDGIYRAWLSLEYRNCGNGHYYLLINENTAVFCEDD